MTNVIALPKGPLTPEIIGPFSVWYLSVDGHQVPYLTATPNEDGTFGITLDNRFQVTCSQAELDKWLWFLANAMAVAAGKTSFGELSNQRNLFKSPISKFEP